MKALPTPLWLTAAICLAAGAACRGAKVDLGNAAWLEMSNDGRVSDVGAEGKSIATGRPGGFALVEVLSPKGTATQPVQLSGRPRPAGKNAHGFEYALEQRKLTLKAEMISLKDAMRVQGEIRNLDAAADRAVQLDFVVPVRCDGWVYHSGIEAAEPITGDAEYPRDRYRLLRFGDPSDRELLRTSQLWFNCICDGQVGLAVGNAPDAPAAFRIGRDKRGLFIRYHLGLTPLTKKFPGAARFSFVVYGNDGRWGIRSAAERFYGLFGEAFRRRASKFGSWSGTNAITHSDLPNKEDFHITYGDNDFQWNDGQYWPKLGQQLKALGIIVFHWREPWSYFLTGSDPQKTADEELQLLRDQAAGKAPGKTHSQMCGAPLKEAAAGVLNSYMLDAAGKMLRVRWQYGCRFIAPNMDPELPRPNRATLAADYQFRWIKRWDDPKFDGPRNLAWDSATPWTGIDLFSYRREHFATADYPLTYDPRDGRVCQMKVLTDREFAVWHSRKVRDKGGLVMANSGLYSLLFFGDCMDVPVLESVAHKQFRWPERMGLYRLLIHQKPLSFYQEITLAGIQRCLLYGLAPGGDCQHEEYRPLTKKYMPTIRAAARAGWQPVTHAHGQNCYVERFGTRPGEIYLTVMNRSEKSPADAALSIDCAALGLDPAKVKVRERIEDRGFESAVEAKTLTLRFKLQPDEALAFAL